MIEIWISNQEVWWNRGVEVKPSRKAFERFTFEKVNNFNVNWIDELHIDVIVPNGKKANLIKIVDPNDDDNVTTKYYYLVEVLNKTNKNKECIYQMDIWLTFILKSNILNAYNTRTIRNLKLNDVNKFVEIEPVGTPTGYIDSKLVDFNLGDFKPPQEYREMYGEETFKLRKSIPTKLSGGDLDIDSQDGEQIYGYDDNVYFVFTETRNAYHSSALLNHNRNNYILIPVLNISLLGFYTYIPKLTTYSSDLDEIWYGPEVSRPYDWNWLNKYNFICPMVYLNSLRNLLKLLETFKSIQSSGLGEFVGVWVGPSFWRIKFGEYSTSGLTLPNRKDIASCFPNLFCVFTDSYIVAKKNGFEFVDSPAVYKKEMEEIKKQGGFNGTKRINFHGSANNVVRLDYETKTGFLALKVSANSLKLEPLEKNWEDYLKNYKYFDLSNLTRNMNQVFFNRKFTFTNGKDNIDLDIQVPTAHDQYQNLLKQQEASMNTSLKLSGANAILSAIGGAFGLIPPPPSESITTTDFNTVRDIDTTTKTGPQSITSFKEKHVLGAIKSKSLKRKWTDDKLSPRKILSSVDTSYKRAPDAIVNLKSGVQREALERVNTGTVTNTGTRTSTRIGNRSIGVGGYLGAALGIAHGGLQFASTLAQQQAYKQSLRLSTTNSISNYTDSYTQYYLHLTKKKNIKLKDVNDIHDPKIKNFMNKEIFYGVTTDTGNQHKFYGFEDIPKNLPFHLEGNPPVLTPVLEEEAYIQIDELTKFNLEIHLSDKYSPTIKNAILTLLTNGVRMTENLTPYTTYFGMGEDKENEST